MLARTLAVVAALGASSAGHAFADPAEGVGVGPRVENGVAGFGLDYWAPGFGVSGMLGGSFSAENIDLGDGDDASDNAWSIRGSVGAFLPLAAGDRSRLALGVRAAVLVVEVTALPNSFVPNGSRTVLSLQAPLRLQWFATDRIAIHSEVGLALQRTSAKDEFGIGFPGGPQDRRRTTWAITDFASPIGNVGVTYFF